LAKGGGFWLKFGVGLAPPPPPTIMGPILDTFTVSRDVEGAS
jgi:hypothetical protein